MPLETPEAGVSKRVPATALASVPVLVVDDDGASNTRVRAALATLGCRLEIVPSAERALLALCRFQPRAVVMDLVQPLMSGLLLAHRLKQDAPTRHVVLIALAGFGGPETARVAREAGFAAYWTKPVDPAAFARGFLALVESAP